VLPARFKIESDWGMICESGQGALGGVEDGLELGVDPLELGLLFGREGRVDVDVRVGVRDGADGFRSVVGGPFIQVLLRQAALERRGGGEEDRRVVRAQR
jgi:hypothetical protein